MRCGGTYVAYVGNTFLDLHLCYALTFFPQLSSRELPWKSLSMSVWIAKDCAGGIYTKWAADLSAEQFYGLLWMVDEFGIRASAHDPQSNARYLAPRRDASRQALIDCVRGHARILAGAQQMIVTGTNGPVRGK